MSADFPLKYKENIYFKKERKETKGFLQFFWILWKSNPVIRQLSVIHLQLLCTFSYFKTSQLHCLHGLSCRRGPILPLFIFFFLHKTENMNTFILHLAVFNSSFSFFNLQYTILIRKISIAVVTFIKKNVTQFCSVAVQIMLGWSLAHPETADRKYCKRRNNLDKYNLYLTCI